MHLDGRLLIQGGSTGRREGGFRTADWPRRAAVSLLVQELLDDLAVVAAHLQALVTIPLEHVLALLQRLQPYDAVQIHHRGAAPAPGGPARPASTGNPPRAGQKRQRHNAGRRCRKSPSAMIMNSVSVRGTRPFTQPPLARTGDSSQKRQRCQTYYQSRAKING